MAYIAQTTLPFDKDGGKRGQFEEGEVVKKNSPSEEVFERWVEDGSIVQVGETAAEVSANAELDAANARVAELEKQLAEAKKGAGAASTAPKPATAAGPPPAAK
jgi:hypothetical protein